MSGDRDEGCLNTQGLEQRRVHCREVVTVTALVLERLAGEEQIVDHLSLVGQLCVGRCGIRNVVDAVDIKRFMQTHGCRELSIHSAGRLLGYCAGGVPRKSHHCGILCGDKRTDLLVVVPGQRVTIVRICGLNEHLSLLVVLDRVGKIEACRELCSLGDLENLVGEESIEIHLERFVRSSRSILSLSFAFSMYWPM